MGLFNLFNGYLVAAGLAFYPPQAEVSWKFWLGVGGWALGFFANVYHDEMLNDLRRQPGERLINHHLPEDDDPKAGRYKIPRGGLFKFVSFPNYLSEWIEWSFYALAATSNPLIPLPPISQLRLQAGLRGSLVKVIAKTWWPSYLLHPAWMFVLAEIASMLPRALRGHRWYKEKFSNYPKERKAVIPGLL
nr:3-oxo-5-alpha-steroid 4-dehydrogenase 1 [Kwoniella pini CBS 10737]OCF49838.1 3-oxo-5-alpha-steroid 4-dehydrogenase 1 [Kwoniella pini CBS 10737]